jgi:hypothetical protein
MTRIGPWRLLDLVQATMPWRASMFGGGAVLPEYGPPDATIISEPEQELPGSNITDGEQQQAVQRERAHRFMRARRREQAR